jgi:hypothetical protein
MQLDFPVLGDRAVFPPEKQREKPGDIFNPAMILR